MSCEPYEYHRRALIRMARLATLMVKYQGDEEIYTELHDEYRQIDADIREVYKFNPPEFKDRRRLG